MFRRGLSLVIAALAVTAGTVAVATPAHAGPGEREFVSRANGARASNGQRAYAVRADLIAVARRHAQRMAARGTIWHNPNLGGEVDNWRAVGENVGMGGSVAAIHQAFMNSSGHRANILDREFTEIGVGTAIGGDGRIFVAQVFRRPMSSTRTSPRPTTTRTAPRTLPTTRTPPARRPAVRRPASVVRPVAAPQLPRRIDPAAVLRARIVALASRPAASPAGLLDAALTYHERMRTLGT